MSTAAQQKRSASKNKYNILYPFEAIMIEMMDKIIIKIDDNIIKNLLMIIQPIDVKVWNLKLYRMKLIIKL